MVLDGGMPAVTGLQELCGAATGVWGIGEEHLMPHARRRASDRITMPLPSAESTNSVLAVHGAGMRARWKASMSTATWTTEFSTCRLPITGPQRRMSAAGVVSNEEHAGSRTASREVPAAAHPDGWADIPGAIGCTLENRLFRDAYDDFRAAGAEVRGVSTQRLDEQRVFAVEEGIPFTLLSDVELRLAAALRLPVFRAGQALRLKRAVLVVDRERVVRQARFPVTDIPGAVREALAVVRRVAAGR
ncbi:redoxin domain-containing protein [Streptomyces lutosisoli]|uniref:Redoxin domain-containing protein n=1 Tax=Streptomyces lutosisoli TaxID=2665721 RepID=A0ABW2VPW5_9ACTN